MLVDHSQSTQYDDDEKDLFVDLGHRVPDVLLEVSIVVIPTLFVEKMYKQHEYHLDITLLLFCFFVQIALGFLQRESENCS